LAGSANMQLKTFDVASDGTFTGTVSESLNLLGYTLASATFQASPSINASSA